jgi:hypothetical protein
MNMRPAKAAEVRSTPHRFTIARAWIMIVLIAAALASATARSAIRRLLGGDPPRIDWVRESPGPLRV